MIFQQGEVELPEWLKCTYSVIMLKPGAKNYFQIPISCSSSHDIVLKKNIIFGRAEYINLVILLAVKFNTNNIIVSSIDTNEEDKCNQSITVRKNQPVNQSTIFSEEKTEDVPKATTEHQQNILISIDLFVTKRTNIRK